MSGKRKAALFIVFSLTVVAVLVFASLWPPRHIVAWVLLAVFGPLALVTIASQVKEMSKQHNYRKMSSKQRQTAQPKESYTYD